MNDHNPTEPKQDPTETTGTDAALPTAENEDVENTTQQMDYEADTRPSIGTLQSMKQDSAQQNPPEQNDASPDDLAALRAKSQNFLGAVPNIAQSASPPPMSFAAASADNSLNNEAAMAKAANVQARYGDKLLQLPHVVGVGIGYMKDGDQVTQQVALVVMVDQKIEPNQLQPEQRIPTQLEGVPIMVQEVGTFTAY
jgi:hypothetical protein